MYCCWLGVFQPHIVYLLCLATPVDIVLLGVSFLQPADASEWSLTHYHCRHSFLSSGFTSSIDFITYITTLLCNIQGLFFIGNRLLLTCHLFSGRLSIWLDDSPCTGNNPQFLMGSKSCLPGQHQARKRMWNFFLVTKKEWFSRVRSLPGVNRLLIKTRPQCLVC